MAKKKSGPTTEDYDRGHAFAAWLNAALALKQWSAKTLSDESTRLLGEGMSPGYLGILLKGGYRESTNTVIQPSTDFIERVAKLTGARLEDGMKAARQNIDPHLGRTLLLPTGFPTEAEKALATLLQMFQNPATERNIVHTPAPEEIAQTHTEEEPLLAIGRRVDVRPLGMIPLAPFPVSADPAAPNEMMEAPPRVTEDAMAEPIRNIVSYEIKGDCMEPFYQDGDVVFITPGPDASPGDKVIAELDDKRFTCKIYREDSSTGLPYLEDAADQRLSQKFQIHGRATGFYRREQRR